MFVVEEARRQGVFRTLQRWVVEKAKKQAGVKCVRLYVETENDKAMQVYEALGMQKLSHYNFDEQDWVL